MKIVGSKKLIKQLGDLPDVTHAALRKSIKNNAKYGERKAKSLVPVDTKTGSGLSLIHISEPTRPY